MKTDFLLIRNYWRYNKKQFFSILVSIFILMSLLVVAVLLERTECRRKFEDVLYGYGSGNRTYRDMDVEDYEKLCEDERVDAIGRIEVGGKMGNESAQYTFGAYLDDSSENLEYLKLSSGRFPEKAGEIAIYDYVLKEMFFTTDPDSYIGKEITLQQYDFLSENTNETGDLVGERTFTITGIISEDERRSLKEYATGWEGHSVPNCISTPIIYIYKDDYTQVEISHEFEMIRIKNTDVITEEQSAIESELISSISSGKVVDYQGANSAAQEVCQYSIGSERIFSRIYPTDSMQIIYYFSVIAVIISAISLFGILTIVMKKRMRSLLLIKNIGCSRRRIFRIIFLEWCCLLISGLIGGSAIGTVIYEIVLWIQHKYMGLSALQGFSGEWAVLQVTKNPYAVSAACTVIMFALGYIVYFVQFLLLGKIKFRKQKRVRCYRKIKAKMSGMPFTNFLQMLSLALVFATIIMCYSYFTTDGKGEGYFTEPVLSDESYYNYGHGLMNKNNVDVCIYNTNNTTGGGTVVYDSGVPDDQLQAIEKIDGVSKVYANVEIMNLLTYYPAGSEEVPSLIRQYANGFADDADEFFKKDEREYYSLSALFGNDMVMSSLSKYVTEGEIGAHKNGVAVVMYQVDGVSSSPYNVGDKINTFSVDASKVGEYHDSEIVVDAIVVIPESAEEDDSITYSLFGYASGGICLAAPHETAVNLNTYKFNYDIIDIQIADGYNRNKVVSQISNYLDSSMYVKMQTIMECDRAFTQKKIELYASIVVLFVVLMLLTVIGYCSLISMRIYNSTKNVAIMRSVGMTDREWICTFVWQNTKNALVSCAAGGILVYAIRFLMTSKYNEALDLFGYPEGWLYDIGVSDETIAKVNDIQHRYLLNYEMQSVSVVKEMVIVGLVLTVGVMFVSWVFLYKNRKNSIISQIMNDEKRE